MKFKIGTSFFLIIVLGSQALAAPAAQVSCIYEAVPADRVSEFGQPYINPDQQMSADLGPIFNAAENACIGQYDWSETDAHNAGQYLAVRSAREALGALFKEAGLDSVNLDRAYAAIKGQLNDAPEAAAKNRDLIKAALQKQGFPTASADLMQAAYAYIGLWTLEDKTVADFGAARKTAN